MMLLKKSKNIWDRFRKTWQSGGAKGVFFAVWARFWMRFAGLSPFGRIATYLAAWFSPPYFGRSSLAYLYPKGYIAPSATIHHADLRLGANICINDRAIIYQAEGGGPVELGERVFIYCDNIIQTGRGGSMTVGADTHIHPRCIFSAYKAKIQIGCRVLIAPNCAFYPYNHGFAEDEPIRKQPLQTKGDIIVGDDAWLGFGVIVLDGVKIGKGAVIGAGSVVTHNVPDGAVVVGVPARVVRMRDLTHKISEGRDEIKVKY